MGFFNILASISHYTSASHDTPPLAASVVPDQPTPEVPAVMPSHSVPAKTAVFQHRVDAVKDRSIDAFFTNRFDATSREIVYNPKWENTTGYFDGLVSAVDASIIVLDTDRQNPRLIKPCEQVKCTDPHGRRMLITGTAIGPIVVFERYSGKTLKAGQKQIYVHNAPPALKRMGALTSTTLSEEQLLYVLGDATHHNVGYSVDELRTTLVTYYEYATQFEKQLPEPVQFGRL